MRTAEFNAKTKVFTKFTSAGGGSALPGLFWCENRAFTKYD